MYLKVLFAFMKEHISSEDGNGKETDAIDGTGGYYYNKVTGQVRINPTMPVRYYLGPTIREDEITSKW